VSNAERAPGHLLSAPCGAIVSAYLAHGDERRFHGDCHRDDVFGELRPDLR